MRKEYALIENERYKLIILLEEIDFDYYTDVYIHLIFDNKTILIFNDNLFALKNVVEQFKENIDILCSDLDEKRLGILRNDYYRALFENDFQNDFKLDSQGFWRGEKYCCYMSTQYATWIYRYNGKIILKVTPDFVGFEEKDYTLKYGEFVKEYKDVFRDYISLHELFSAKKVILDLYDSLL